MAIAGYDPNAWKGEVSDWINTPQVQAPQIQAPSGGYSPSAFQGTLNLPTINGTGGGTYNTGTQQFAGGTPMNIGFGEKYNSFMGKYGQSIGQGISAAGALFNLYGGIKSLGLMSKQFKLAKKTTRLGVDNAAIAGNNQIKHHTTATQNSSGRQTAYTPFKGWDG
jgi:hypothetical protein